MSNNSIKDRKKTKSSLPPAEIILSRTADIVMNEHRPVSYLDFQSFEWNGITKTYSHGTIRNYFSRLSRQGKIELDYKSPQAFYTLPGVKVGKVMTPHYIVGQVNFNDKQRNLIKLYGVLELDNPAIHDIRLRFTCIGLREIVLKSNSDLIDHVDVRYNKNITLKKITQGDITLTLVIHNTDTVSIMIACTDNPIPVDIIGLPKLISILTRMEERLQGIINDHNRTNPINSTTDDNNKITIPNHITWIVTMLHFGYDSEPRLTGEMFELTLKEHLEVFRVYSKKRRKTNNKI
ncbi:MAG: hypothetical protein L0H53_16255 [Candidatus Nitrosocosmicus sp.]|nr:hypothetical protein [Candidatus Nitrosocosmicus sp.]